MSVIAAIKSVIKKLPGVRKVVSERDQLRKDLGLGFVPPGHFHSPIPSKEDILGDESKIFGGDLTHPRTAVPHQIPGIDLRESDQLRVLEQFIPFYSEMPFQPSKTKGLRYFFENVAYSYSDAIFLHCMIRYLKPNRIIEVGSGYSSCMTLDTNELFFSNSISTTFIEPYPDLLMSLLKETDKNHVRVIPRRLQDIDFVEFETLGAHDILFIDSTHVSKVNSDVNRIFFDILPRLAPGVHIHFHDVFFPFEYPKEWLLEGRAWNEAYMLRTFLQYNKSFEIVLMNTYLEYTIEPFFREKMPLCLVNRGGSIWIRKVSK